MTTLIIVRVVVYAAQMTDDVKDFEKEINDAIAKIDSVVEKGTDAALKAYEACPDNADCTKLLGVPFFEQVRQEMEGCVNFLQIDSDTAGLRFYNEGQLNLLYTKADFEAGKWKLVRAYMSSC